MIYLIMRETKYQHTSNAYDVVDCTEDHEKALEKLQGYILINDRKDRTYTIIKYESPLLLTKEMEV
jgi:hypothetical protein